MTYEIRCAFTGDEAEASTPGAALLAARTLVDDATATVDVPGQSDVLAARRSLLILRDGRADVELTRRAQNEGHLEDAA